MVQFLDSSTAQVVVLLALAAVLVAVGVYVIGKVRRDLTSDADGASQLLSNFRDLHSQGGLSDEEYRTIKAMLAERLDAELTGKSGPPTCEKSSSGDPDAKFKADVNLKTGERRQAESS